jgi:GntP family gluconate:H+ symporter
MWILILLLVILILMVIAITRWKLHPFIALLLAAVCIGLASGLELSSVIAQLTDGFGVTLKSIGIVIAFGTIIGTFLEKSGSAALIAATVLKLVGQNRSALAMNISGFIISIPVFCDSGFVILASINKALSKSTGISLSVLAVALGSGLYATHVFVPPTPGPLAAAATIGADIGLVILFGLIVSIPAALAGLFWAKFYCTNFSIRADDFDPVSQQNGSKQAPLKIFAPIIVPIVLIALKSVAEYPTLPLGHEFVYNLCVFAGHPVVALLIGVFISFSLFKKGITQNSRFDWVAEGLKNAGTIILITGAGGAFGAVLRVIGIGDTIGNSISQLHLGIFLPFLIAAVLKSAQGSSTVAIITTAALITPLLDSLGLSYPVAKALVVLAIGAGAMTVSHLNDSYFWVVSQFSNLDTAVALRCHTLATLLQGIVSIVVIFILNLMFS